MSSGGTWVVKEKQMNKELKGRMPLLVACSGLVKTKELESDLKAVGFDTYI